MSVLLGVIFLAGATIAGSAELLADWPGAPKALSQPSG